MLKKELENLKFFKVHPILFVLKDSVDEEIFCLVKEGILEPIKTAEWTTPIVSILQSNDNTRICRNFKQTTIKSTELEQY